MANNKYKELASGVFKQRERLKTSADALYKRIEDSPLGPKSKDWARKVVVNESFGGVGWALFNVAPIIERAEGSILYDVDGKEYIDMLSGFACSSLGNNDPEVTKIIQEHAGKLTHFFDLPHPERIKLAENLNKYSRIDGPTKVVFGVTGSDAIELAIRAARYYTGKPNILVAYGDYHGVTYGTMALTSKGNMQPIFFPVTPDQHVGYFHMPHDYRTPQDEHSGYDMDAIRMLERALDGKESPFADGPNCGNVAAILVEPFQSSAGYYIPPKAYLQELRRICDKFGLLLIIDEIQAGMGRSGKLWAFEHSEIEPDMFVTAKGVGGGLPLSAVVAKEEILMEWPTGAHVSTQAGNVLACAAGNYVLEKTVDPAFLDSVNKKGEYFRKGFDEIMKRHPLLGWVENKGLYLGLEFVMDRKTKEPAAAAANYMRDAGIREGMIFEKGGYYHNRIQLIPALNIPEKVMDKAHEIFDKIIGEAEKKFGVK